jgi:predicted nuclease of predicted toxin-antitoxin system
LTLKVNHTMRRLITSCALLILALPSLVAAQAALKTAVNQWPIFDAHLHYNVEAFGEGAANAPYPMAKVFEIFKRNNVTAVIANSRPNSGTLALWERQKTAQGAVVVPFIRLYRDRADYQTWHSNPEIWQMIQKEYAKGVFRGIGEFHLYNSGHAKGETAVKVMKFAQEKNLVVLAHCDDVAIETLLRHAPQAKVIWAHTGFGTSVQRIDSLLRQFPGLMGELSYRGGMTNDAAGKVSVSAEWRQLFTQYPNRFLLGSDTWVNGRWEQYDATMQDYRAMLADLPEAIGQAIAWKNGYQLFGLPLPKVQ